MNFSKIRFYQNFRIYCDKFDNKLIYCLSRFIAGNFSSAPTSITKPFFRGGKTCQCSLLPVWRELPALRGMMR